MSGFKDQVFVDITLNIESEAVVTMSSMICTWKAFQASFHHGGA